MKIAICEDNKSQSDILKQMVIKWSIKSKIAIDIKCYLSAEAFLFAMPDYGLYDVLLLDIQMKEISGIELAKKLREQKNEVIIIFITALKEYVFEGYNVDALHYLIKPIDNEILAKVLDKAKSRMTLRENEFILVNQMKIYYEDILYIESINHYIYIHTKTGTEKIYGSMHEFMKDINSDIFMQCHRSFILNIANVVRLTKTDAILDDGTNIPISRNKLQFIKRTFIDYNKGSKIL